MKNLTLIVLFLITLPGYSQRMGVKYSSAGASLMMSVPVNTATNGNIMLTVGKEHDRRLGYVQYIESFKINKLLSLYYGIGVHFGNRQTLNYKRDGNTTFLAGPSAIGGIRLNVNKTLFISTDVMPRTDIPIFGGCEEHRYCSESTIGAVNLSVGISLK